MNLIQALTRRLRPAAEIDENRWVVLDVESSGLDPKRDRLLAIAAIALHTEGQRARIVLGDSFEVVLRQDIAVADKSNRRICWGSMANDSSQTMPRSASRKL